MRSTFLFAALSICLAEISFAAQALTADEQTFIQKAATSDQTEIKLSRLALERASMAATVRGFETWRPPFCRRE